MASAIGSRDLKPVYRGLFPTTCIPLYESSHCRNVVNEGLISLSFHVRSLVSNVNSFATHTQRPTYSLVSRGNSDSTWVEIWATTVQCKSPEGGSSEENNCSSA